MSLTPHDDVPESVSTVSRPTAPIVVRTRKQQQAAAEHEQAQLRAHWKRVMPGAQAKWPRLDPQELTLARGNRHRLAGLVQLRYQLSREQADQQVAEFFAAQS